MKLKCLVPLALMLSFSTFAKKTPEDIWRETGLTFDTYITQTINQKNCTLNAKTLTACASTLNMIANQQRHDEKRILIKINLNDQEITTTEVDLTHLTSEEYFEAYKIYLNELYLEAQKIESYLPMKKININEKINQLNEQIKNKNDYSLIAANIFNNFLSIAIDPHTYISAASSFENAARDKEDNRGIGIRFNPNLNNLSLVEVYKNSPADHAGLKKNDQIIRINLKENIKEMINELSQNDELNLLIKRGSKELSFKVTKSEYSIDQLEMSIINKDNSSYGYIKLRSFMVENACQQIMLEAIDMINKNVSGFILDLRDNGGGNVNVAMCIKNLFLEKGSIIWVNKYDETNNLYASRTLLNSPKPFKNYHNVVLINGLSASASESTSMFLKDYRKAYIVGEASFGKGSMQGVEENPSNPKILLAATQGLFFGPKGISPQLTGVIPDFEVFPEIDQKKPSKFYREKDSHILPIPLSQPSQDDYIQTDRKEEISTIKDCVSKTIQANFDQLVEDLKPSYDHQLEYGVKVIDCAIENEIPVFRRLDIPYVKSFHYELERNFISEE